jgi:predicted transcriptional regulator
MIRRSRLEILFDVIKYVGERGEVRGTRVMYGTNLRWRVLREELDYLEKKELIRSRQKDSRVFFSLTPEGLALLKRIEDFETAFASGPLVGGLLADQEAAKPFGLEGASGPEVRGNIVAGSHI